MSTHSIPILDNDAQGITGLRDIVALAIRAPNEIRRVGGNVEYDFTPDLSPAEQAALADIVATLRTHDVRLTPTDYVALKSALSDLRAFRMQSAAEFTALTTAQRDAALRTALFGTIDVLRALLRD